MLYPSARIISFISTANTRGRRFALVNAVEALVMKAGEFRQSVFSEVRVVGGGGERVHRQREKGVREVGARLRNTQKNTC